MPRQDGTNRTALLYSPLLSRHADAGPPPATTPHHRVGGYDERFGWGLDDKELGYRFGNAGVHGFSIRYTAPVYHLWHERPWVDLSALPAQETMLAETRRTGSPRTDSRRARAAAVIAFATAGSLTAGVDD